MEPTERRLFDALLVAHLAKQAADVAWVDVAAKAWQLVQRTGALYYKGHVIEIRGTALDVRQIRSLPAEVEE